jgi:hypothetical protein
MEEAGLALVSCCLRRQVAAGGLTEPDNSLTLGLSCAAVTGLDGPLGGECGQLPKRIDQGKGQESFSPGCDRIRAYVRWLAFGPRKPAESGPDDRGGVCPAVQHVFGGSGVDGCGCLA